MTWRSTSHSSYFMAFGVELLLPFNIIEATFLLPEVDSPVLAADLIALRTCQLAKWGNDLFLMHEWVLKSCQASTAEFKWHLTHKICSFDFWSGFLILILNKQVDSALNIKCSPHDFSPMVVLSCTPQGIYQLAKIDEIVLRLRFATFHLILYHPCSETTLQITQLNFPHNCTEVPIDDEDFFMCVVGFVSLATCCIQNSARETWSLHFKRGW